MDSTHVWQMLAWKTRDATYGLDGVYDAPRRDEAQGDWEDEDV